MTKQTKELTINSYGRLLFFQGRRAIWAGWVPTVFRQRRRWWDKIHPKAKKYPERLRWDA